MIQERDRHTDAQTLHDGKGRVAKTFYGWLRLMNSTAAYGGGSGAYMTAKAVWQKIYI